ncbi:sulfurtransferase [Deinococcus psychrotolerans]|uniref:Sulfurtransferase n=1 Tax=Deinococcus psychrotolerans TaxID=2489213 RepID=A0A3G8YF62_9DEIO|nr:sulfurtransferase [Deinococcus psychrotolerans]AZI43605.1 sulfurtransferase [Deinococcus psychrotolerans]
MPSPLISAADFVKQLDHPMLRVLDTRYALADPLSGRLAYGESHVPSAVFADLETDLSGEVQPSGAGGRHPLPDPQTLADWLGKQGIGDEHQVVIYDDPSTGQGFYAAHAWWLLRWLGHIKVQVLDGGWPAYLAAGGEVSTEEPAHVQATFTPDVQQGWLASADEVASLPQSVTLIDSRAAARYRGDTEPMDKKAGHIPGATNRDWASSLSADGTFKALDEQAERFPAGEVVLYCGSGVSAAGNLLALAVAGREPGPGVRLYAGSWSDWVSDDTRAVATGEES